jgi:7-carboxy-7-deazaguanine synthase
VGKQFPDLPLYLSVGNPQPPADDAAGPVFNTWQRGEADVADLLARYDWICQMVLQRSIRAIVTPQMHVLAWGNKRGV